MVDTPLPHGFSAFGMRCGIKREGRGDDLGLLLVDRACPARAVFTRNRLIGAHITLCREHLALGRGLLRAIVVNSGNANCATGAEGVEDARKICAAAAAAIGCPAEQVLCISTGVIGARLPIDRILDAVPELCRSASPAGLPAFARAIMTTDTHPKVETEELAQDGGLVRITGIAKGAGMIHPDMATLLGFLLTDRGTAKDLHALLRRVVDRSFHRVTIDGDTSPNDTVVLWTSERIWRNELEADQDPFEDVLVDVAGRLCRQIARDGEGATRLITIEVRGAHSAREATEVGRTIATSPLTKTAVAGRDPNWGRILSAACRARAAVDIDHARVWVGGATVFANGRPQPEQEPEAARHLRDNEEVVLGVDLAAGGYQADVWTCDLTADYVRINADYRT